MKRTKYEKIRYEKKVRRERRERKMYLNSVKNFVDTIKSLLYVPKKENLVRQIELLESMNN